MQYTEKRKKTYGEIGEGHGRLTEKPTSNRKFRRKERKVRSTIQIENFSELKSQTLTCK